MSPSSSGNSPKTDGVVEFLQSLLLKAASTYHRGHPENHPIVVINSLKNILGDVQDNPSKILMDFGKDYKIYDPNYADHPNHNHIICDDCDKVVEFESDQLDTLENEISQNLGFHVKTQQLRINASCDEMKKLGACSKKDQ